MRPKTVKALVENDDYYMDGDKLVFTAAYHLKRGFCCNHGCRHCPYKGNEVITVQAPQLQILNLLGKRQ